MKVDYGELSPEEEEYEKDPAKYTKEHPEEAKRIHLKRKAERQNALREEYKEKRGRRLAFSLLPLFASAAAAAATSRLTHGKPCREDPGAAVGDEPREERGGCDHGDHRDRDRPPRLCLRDHRREHLPLRPAGPPSSFPPVSIKLARRSGGLRVQGAVSAGVHRAARLHVRQDRLPPADLPGKRKGRGGR
eukprot:3227253-Rhodomonas_salina.1